MGQQVTTGTWYCLPLKAIVACMRFSPTLVLLQAHVAALPGISQQPCLAHVVVGHGCLHGCTILSLAGSILLEHRAAYDVLACCGDLEWEVVTAPLFDQPAQAVSSTPPLLSTQPGKPWDVPTLRVKPVPHEVFARLPHPARIALALVDGKRTLAMIADLLHKTPQEIWQILVDLRDVVQF